MAILYSRHSCWSTPACLLPPSPFLFSYFYLTTVLVATNYDIFNGIQRLHTHAYHTGVSLIPIHIRSRSPESNILPVCLCLHIWGWPPWFYNVLLDGSSRGVNGDTFALMHRGGLRAGHLGRRMHRYDALSCRGLQAREFGDLR